MLGEIQAICSYGSLGVGKIIAWRSTYMASQIPTLSGLKFLEIAEREKGDLRCPVELAEVLKSAFAKLDQELLQWLKGVACSKTSTLAIMLSLSMPSDSRQLSDVYDGTSTCP